jgi:branched-chain amino acid aminotransferase
VKVILNGDLIDQTESMCDERGWLAGSGVFETIKTVDNLPWALSRHMRRVVSSAQTKGIKLPSEDQIRSGVDILLSNERFSQGVLRLSFSEGGNWSAVHLEYEPLVNPAKLVSYEKLLKSNGQPLKSFPYDHRLEILKAAQDVGADEAIVINDKGRVCEGSVTNLLLQIDGEWITPPISDGVLPGIVRALVIENCGVSVRSISESQLIQVSSGFLLSSLRIAQPIESINGRELLHSPEFRAEIEAMALRTSVG